MKLKKLIPTMLIPLSMIAASCSNTVFYNAEYVTGNGDTLDLSMRIKEIESNELGFKGEVFFGVESNIAKGRIMLKGYFSEDTSDIKFENFHILGSPESSLRQYLQIDSLENLYRYAVENGQISR